MAASSYGTINPFAEAHGNGGDWSWFLTGNFLKNDTGIENPTPARDAILGHTQQSKLFGSISYLFNDTTRASLMFGSTNNRFEIPNNPDQAPGYALAGVGDFDSRDLDEHQQERTPFGIFSLQGSLGNTDYQVSLGQRYTSVDYQPDPVGDCSSTASPAPSAAAIARTPCRRISPMHSATGTRCARACMPVSNIRQQQHIAGVSGRRRPDQRCADRIVDNAPHVSAKKLRPVRAGRMATDPGADDQLRTARRFGRCLRQRKPIQPAHLFGVPTDGTRLGADFLFGSGLRRGFANSEHLPACTTINLSAQHDFNIGVGGPFNVRLAVLNLTDHIHERRDGSGIGVGAPPFGARRGAYVTLSKSF